jgi:hypothetical protein
MKSGVYIVIKLQNINPGIGNAQVPDPCDVPLES